MRTFITRIRQILLGDQIKEDKIGVACRTHERDEEYIENVNRST